MNAPRRSQHGFALIGAIFLLVVLAALGAFAVRVNMKQQHSTDLELQGLRAQAALNSGVEYAAARLLAPGANCGNLANLANLLGYEAGRPRSPTLPCPAAEIDRIRQAMRHAGLVD